MRESRERRQGLVLLWLGVALFAGCGGTQEPAEGTEPPPLALRAMTGCWELDVGAWHSAAEDSVAARPSRETRPREIDSLLVAPSRVMLLADSTDEWRRSLRTYRAVPLGETGTAVADFLRWFVRGDTLWLVWSDRRSRAGVALRPDGPILEGSARGFADGDSIGVKARASAWRINCATLQRWEPRRGPRR